MFQFGIGGMYGRPVGGNLGTPSGPQKFGTIQDVNVDMTQKLVKLMGQNKGPDDIAPGDMDVKGKGGFARIEINTYNALYFADAVTTGIKQVTVGEAVTISGTTYQVTNHATFLNDLGLYNTATGLQLNQVTAGTEISGKSYSVNETTGTYTFGSGDTTTTYAVDYAWTNASVGSNLLVKNHIQGYGPTFELYLLQPYQNAGNGLHLFQCRASKMSAPMKRDGYLISDFEFEAFPLPNGNWFEWFQVST